MHKPSVLFRSSMAWVARLFCLRAKFENYFSLWAALLKIVSYDKVTIFAIDLFMLLLTVFDQISGSRRSMMLFLLAEKGPRAAKISWRAALWTCLIYVNHDTLCKFIVVCPT